MVETDIYNILYSVALPDRQMQRLSIKFVTRFSNMRDCKHGDDYNTTCKEWT